MQPFALFNLLKSTLFSENPDSADQLSSVQNPLPTNEQNERTDHVSNPENPKTDETNQEKPNACSDFLLRHEIRAGRQKKR
ncbi:MAG: hypothetical protein E7343_03970 [Clostridiales bacterium]|nr:hypothetical protein [Clostridiales bacterium]